MLKNIFLIELAEVDAHVCCIKRGSIIEKSPRSDVWMPFSFQTDIGTCVAVRLSHTTLIGFDNLVWFV